MPLGSNVALGASRSKVSYFSGIVEGLQKMCCCLLLLTLLQLASASQQQLLLFGRLDPVSDRQVALNNLSLHSFEAIEAQVRGLLGERLKREAGTNREADSKGEADLKREARRYVIYEKQPEDKEKKKKVRNVASLLLYLYSCISTLVSLLLYLYCTRSSLSTFYIYFIPFIFHKHFSTCILNLLFKLVFLY